MSSNFDVIVIGAGSVGVPAVMSLSKDKKKILCIDNMSSAGQVNNKRAIGGVRATHSIFGKFKVCQRSIEILSTWKELYGDDIGWLSNGYSFPAYTEVIEKFLLSLVNERSTLGLNISYVKPDEYQKLVPGILMEGLRGATYSPEDGSCSPLLTCNAMFFKSIEYGAKYAFNEIVLDVKYDNSVFVVQTNKNKYSSEYLINASGNNAKTISEMLGFECPVVPDSHEAAITEPVKRFFGPMVVDLREDMDSKNFYFYQNNEGQVIFCLTPEPLIYGVDSDATSEFLPLCAKRLLKVYPRLTALKIRRQWRGQYPMTPDASPIIGHYDENKKFIQAVGMCGQGFMMGPGLGELLNRIVNNNLTEDDLRTLKSFEPRRDFTKGEEIK
ncbi:MAG: FAD-binding oxidoreductase [Candidatus Cloacimonetes bacterium]|nr:FAD-binding oxidoreductase [Candidatus Cloacimonadota bacterium]